MHGDSLPLPSSYSGAAGFPGPAVDGFHCPLTAMAEAAGAPSGSVTDIYLPTWFARNLPAIHVPLLVLSVWLHGRTLRHRAAGGERR